MNLPKGWTQVGELPAVGFDEADEAARAAFEEDILRIADPSGKNVVDVGWYPAEAASGRFVCRVIEDDAWDSPAEQFESRDLAKVSAWLSASVESLMAVIGATAELKAPEGILRVTLIRARARKTAKTESCETKVRAPRLEATTSVFATQPA
jgi:hypothetical protein